MVLRDLCFWLDFVCCLCCCWIQASFVVSFFCSPIGLLRLLEWLVSGCVAATLALWGASLIIGCCVGMKGACGWCAYTCLGLGLCVSVSLCHCASLALCLCVCVSKCLCVWVSACLCVCVSLCLSVCVWVGCNVSGCYWLFFFGCCWRCA